MAQKSAEQNSKAVKTLMGCKTLNEFTEAQNRIAQQSFDEWVNGTSKLSEQCVKILTDALEPINGQLGKAIKKASEAVSA
jgi:phasin family protein